MHISVRNPAGLAKRRSRLRVVHSFLRCLLVAGVLLGGLNKLAALESDPTVVDESPAVTIGRQELSRYIVDKNYNRFVAQFRGQYGRAPAEEDCKRWFRLFLAQAVIKAQLDADGTIRRQEVQDSVRQMERHILTQPEGLFYQTLYQDQPISPDQLLSIHAASARVFDAIIVRFDDRASAETVLPPGAMWDVRSFLERARAMGGAEIHEGRIIWPYHPFQEVTAELLRAEHGKLLGPFQKKLGAYYLMVRAESRQVVPDFSATSSVLERQVRELDHLMVRRLRRLSVLRECRIRWDEPSVYQFWLTIQGLSERTQFIPSETVARFSNQTLATYEVEGQQQEIAVGEYAAHFNQRLMRQLPRSQAELVVSLQDMMVEECDYRAARRTGLDQQPKFVQDRKNFTLNRALQVYEEEKLVPGILPSPEALRAYYDEHLTSYEEPVEAAGRLYLFDSPDRAAVILSQPGQSPAEKTTLAEKNSERDVLLQRDGLPVLDGVPNPVLLQLADGAAFGPVPSGRFFAVFLKQSTTKRAVPSLEKIEPRVRGDLIRIRLDELELKLARQWEAAQPVTLHVDYSKYGIPDPDDRQGQANAGLTFLSEK